MYPAHYHHSESLKATVFVSKAIDAQVLALYLVFVLTASGIVCLRKCKTLCPGVNFILIRAF